MIVMSRHQSCCSEIFLNLCRVRPLFVLLVIVLSVILWITDSDKPQVVSSIFSYSLWFLAIFQTVDCVLVSFTWQMSSNVTRLFIDTHLLIEPQTDECVCLLILHNKWVDTHCDCYIHTTPPWLNVCLLIVQDNWVADYIVIAIQLHTDDYVITEPRVPS